MVAIHNKALKVFGKSHAKLMDAYEEIKRLKAQAADLDRKAEEEAAQALDRVTSRLEQLAATLESA